MKFNLNSVSFLKAPASLSRLKLLSFLLVLMSTFLVSTLVQAQGWPDDEQDKKYIKRGKKFALIVVLDISGSMSGSPLDNVKKILRDTVAQIPKKTHTGLISFSGCGPDDVKLQVPLAPENKDVMVTVAQGLSAYGMTNINDALAMAAKESKKLKKNMCAQVLLLTDGSDSCGGTSLDMQNYTKTIMEQNPDCSAVNLISIGAIDSYDKKIFDKINEIGTKSKNEHVNVAANDEEGLRKEIELKLELIMEKGKPSKSLEWQGDYDSKKSKWDSKKVKPKEKEKKKELEQEEEEKELEQEKENEKSSGGSK